MYNAPETVEDFLSVPSAKLDEIKRNWLVPGNLATELSVARVHVAVCINRAKSAGATLRYFMVLADEVNEAHGWPLTDRDLVDVIETTLGLPAIPQQHCIRGEERYQRIWSRALTVAHKMRVEDAYLELQRINRYCEPPLFDSTVRALFMAARHG